MSPLVVSRGGGPLQEGMFPLVVLRSGGLLQEEREEMELRKAEMEAAKAENMVEHEAEINARPCAHLVSDQEGKGGSCNQVSAVGIS